jgi:hypothetical protein
VLVGVAWWGAVIAISFLVVLFIALVIGRSNGTAV